MINTPNFWKEKNLISFLLSPLSIIYFIGFKVYEFFSKEVDIGVPVICVGNLVAGGSGKTPITIELRKYLSKKYSKIFVLTRGYKGKLKGPIIVSKNSNYLDVSDEAIIHAQNGLTCMAKNKKLGAELCKKNGANLILMDDGLQSKDIKKNFKILVVDDNYKFGNNFLLPAGPLRQTINSAKSNYDIMLIIRNGNGDSTLTTEKHKNVFYAEKKIKLKKLKYKDVFVFSGIGNNENFVNKLKELKINIKMIKNFPDHHNYSNDDISKIIRTSTKKKLSIVCTEKDYIKIPQKFKKFINVAYLEINIFSSKKLIKLINRKLIKI